jgi:molecular chaperone GrpE
MNGWPDEERILTNFRNWLEQAKAEADGLGENGEPFERQVDSRSVGLFQLAEELTALRHEVKLGTKGARNLEQQAGNVVGALEQAIAQFRSVEASEAAAAERSAGPFVEAVIELDESLRRCRTVIETARQRILEESAKCVEDKLDQTYQQQWFLRRWLSRRLCRAVRNILQEQTEKMHRDILDSLVAGYQLILNRLQRVMKEQEIYRMECVGKPVDPNSMTVIEVVEDSGGPPGLVVEEVRPGYYWKAKVFRYAEVRAIRAQPPS